VDRQVYVLKQTSYLPNVGQMYSEEEIKNVEQWKQTIWRIILEHCLGFMLKNKLSWA